jgi:hypothetical protein
MALRNASAQSRLPFRSANAISGSIIQNSARWRGVLEFSARNVGPKVYTLLIASAYASTLSWPDTVRKRFAAEEILAEIDLAFFIARQVCQIQRGQAEHVARAFGVRRRDDRRVDPEEALLGEMAMDRRHHRVAHARDRAEQIGARAQMCDFAQEFHRMRLGWMG